MRTLSPRISRSRFTRGFTRTELLVTLGCITLLAAILIVRHSRSPEMARRKVCQQNIKQLLACFDDYLAAKGRLPRAARSQKPNDEDWLYWQPDRALEDSAIAPYTLHFGKPLLRCPGDDRVRYRVFQYSYSMNAHLEKHEKAKLPKGNPLILLYEENDPNDGACAAGAASDSLTTRHGGSSTAGFLDGHVERITPATGSMDKHARP